MDISSPEEPALVERALALMHGELAIDDAAIAYACALRSSVLMSLMGDVVTEAPPRPGVEVL